MVQYLTKEEIRQWRSSLEKITLEEFAKRLGKEIEENKRTHDIVDMIVNNEAVSITEEIKIRQKEEEIAPVVAKTAVATLEELPRQEAAIVSSRVENVKITFSKSLTEREQRVLDYLSQKPKISVKAQELAQVLDIPRDYIYKYIRNLRKKIVEDVLLNSDEGGFILNI